MRTVNGEFLLGDVEKLLLWNQLHELAIFRGVELLTFFGMVHRSHGRYGRVWWTARRIIVGAAGWCPRMKWLTHGAVIESRQFVEEHLNAYRLMNGRREKIPCVVCAGRCHHRARESVCPAGGKA